MGLAAHEVTQPPPEAFGELPETDPPETAALLALGNSSVPARSAAPPIATISRCPAELIDGNDFAMITPTMKRKCARRPRYRNSDISRIAAKAFVHRVLLTVNY
jgi:hypothetical protein